MGQLTNAFVAADQPTMSSREISDLLPEVRHDSVKRTIERLADRGVIVRPPMVDEAETDAMGRSRITKVYRVCKRDSFVVVAQLSPEFTARLVDRWQELEAGSASTTKELSSTDAALQLAHALISRDTDLRIANAKVDALEHRVEIDAPKVAFAEGIAAMPGAISIASAAQTIGTGQNRLMAFMKRIGWVKANNEPYQQKVDDGYLDRKVGFYKHPRDRTLQESVTTVVTAKGLIKLQKLWTRWQASQRDEAA